MLNKTKAIYDHRTSTSEDTHKNSVCRREENKDGCNHENIVKKFHQMRDRQIRI
jgi:hypothetical protein